MGYIPYNKNKGGSMEKFEVVFYEKENGYCPVEEFIDALDVKMRAKLVGLLEILEEKVINLENRIVNQLMMVL